MFSYFIFQNANNSSANQAAHVEICATTTKTGFHSTCHFVKANESFTSLTSVIKSITD